MSLEIAFWPELANDSHYLLNYAFERSINENDDVFDQIDKFILLDATINTYKHIRDF